MTNILKSKLTSKSGRAVSLELAVGAEVSGTITRSHYSSGIDGAEGVWCPVSGPCEAGSRARAPMDGFMACPETGHYTALAVPKDYDFEPK